MSNDSSPKQELLELTLQLRRRVELSHESDWAATGKPVPTPSAADGIPERGGSAAPATAVDDPFVALREKVSACRLCPLGEQRLNAVFGVGSPNARVMFIGEGPGFDEDHRGEPFVGKSGQLLDRILESIGLSRRTVYIANVVKCHPMKNPGNPEARGNDRPPTPEEAGACRPYLDDQIRVIGPRVIVTLGAVALRAMLGQGESITRSRGQWREYFPAGGDGAVKLLPTFHPAALLRDPALKKDVWTDMKNLRKELEAA